MKTMSARQSWKRLYSITRQNVLHGQWPLQVNFEHVWWDARRAGLDLSLVNRRMGDAATIATDGVTQEDSLRIDRARRQRAQALCRADLAEFDRQAGRAQP